MAVVTVTLPSREERRMKPEPVGVV